MVAEPPIRCPPAPFSLSHPQVPAKAASLVRPTLPSTDFPSL